MDSITRQPHYGYLCQTICIEKFTERLENDNKLETLAYWCKKGLRCLESLSAYFYHPSVW